MVKEKEKKSTKKDPSIRSLYDIQGRTEKIREEGFKGEENGKKRTR